MKLKAVITSSGKITSSYIYVIIHTTNQLDNKGDHHIHCFQILMNVQKTWTDVISWLKIATTMLATTAAYVKEVSHEMLPQAFVKVSTLIARSDHRHTYVDLSHKEASYLLYTFHISPLFNFCECISLIHAICGCADPFQQSPFWLNLEQGFYTLWHFHSLLLIVIFGWHVNLSMAIIIVLFVIFRNHFWSSLHFSVDTISYSIFLVLRG